MTLGERAVEYHVPVLDSGFTIVDGMSPAGRAVKRLFDIVASAVALVSLSLLLIALGIAVKVEDGGPVIYRQRRVGRYGREFTMLKFRSLKRESVELGADFVSDRLRRRPQNQPLRTFYEYPLLKSILSQWRGGNL